MFGKVEGTVGTSVTMMVIGAVFGVVMVMVGMWRRAAGVGTFGVLWILFWAGFTAWDLYRAAKARGRRAGVLAARSRR